MTPPLRTRLAQGFAGQVYARGVTIAIQLLIIPLLILNWGVATYGEWVVLTSIASYLTLSNFGFVNATQSDLSMRVGEKRHDEALRSFQSTLVVVTALFAGFSILFYVFLEFAPIIQWFNIQFISEGDAKLILYLMAFKVFSSFYSGLFFGGLSSVGRYGYAQFVHSTAQLLEFAAISAIVLIHAGGPTEAAIAAAAVSLAEIAIAWAVMSRHAPWLRVGARECRYTTLKRLLVPSISVAAYHLGTSALLIQGPRLVLSAILGPASVAVYSVITTMARFLLQTVTAISYSVEVELSRSYGGRDLDLARRLHHRAAQLSFWIIMVSSVLLAVAGDWILGVWTGGKVAMDYPLFLIQLLIGALSAVWNVSMIMLIAINRTVVATTALLPAAVLGLALGGLLAKIFGLPGMAAGLLCTETIMLVVVTRRALGLLETTFPAFAVAMTRSPVPLMQEEYRRLRRRKGTRSTS